MSHTCIGNQLVGSIYEYACAVKEATWGHLAPRRNKTYKGRIVFTVGCFGDDPLNPIAIHCEFEDLDSSPWFFSALTKFMEGASPQVGIIYEFVGTFRNYKFAGNLHEMLNCNMEG